MSAICDDSSSVPPMDPDLERRLKATARRLDELGELRDQLIIQAHEEGASLREIAALARMSHVGVKKLLGRHLHPDRIAELADEKREINKALNRQRTWPAGPWMCEHFGFVWTGDISNHHGIEPPAFCPGPHVRDEMGPLLRRLSEGWRLRRDGSLVPPALPDLNDRLASLFGGGDADG